MNAEAERRQAGIVLVVVLHMLSLFGLEGLAFVTYSAAERQCESPTIEIRDGTCVRVVGTTNRQP